MPAAHRTDDASRRTAAPAPAPAAPAPAVPMLLLLLLLMMMMLLMHSVTQVQCLSRRPALVAPTEDGRTGQRSEERLPGRLPLRQQCVVGRRWVFCPLSAPLFAQTMCRWECGNPPGTETVAKCRRPGHQSVEWKDTLSRQRIRQAWQLGSDFPPSQTGAPPSLQHWLGQRAPRGPPNDVGPAACPFPCD